MYRERRRQRSECSIAEVLDERMQVVSKPFKMDALATKIRETIESMSFDDFALPHA